jgi:hypothetical protein
MIMVKTCILLHNGDPKEDLKFFKIIAGIESGQYLILLI